MNRLRKNEKGFTLIELIVVMIIIGILVLLAAPRFLRYIEQAKYTRIINDIKVVEDVGTAYIASRNELPKGTATGDTDLTEEANEFQAYKKDGLIVKGTDDSNFVPEVADISDTELSDVTKGYYKLSRSEFVKPETRTRLRGDFYINKEGEVIYIDSKEASGEIEENKDDAGLFTYKSDDSSSRDSGIITGLNTDHEYWEKDENKVEDVEVDTYIDGKNGKTLLSGRKMPDIPDVRVMDDGKEVKVIEIADNAFRREYDEVNKLGVLVGKDFIAGKNLKKIGDNAFHARSMTGGRDYICVISYTGRFIGGDSLEEVGEHAFMDNNFTGAFDSKNIKTIGRGAFIYNNFNGEFVAGDKLTTVDLFAFNSNNLTGNFKSNKIEEIGTRAFQNNNFNGGFLAGDKLKTINVNAFFNNSFKGDFDSKNIKTIGDSAFSNNKFDGILTKRASLINLSPSAFSGNNFSEIIEE